MLLICTWAISLLKVDTVNGATVRGVAQLLGIFLLKTGHCLQSYCGVNVLSTRVNSEHK
jgi:hypothetical protein